MGVNTDVSAPFFFYKGFGMGEEASGQSFALMDLGYADSVEGKIRLIRAGRSDRLAGLYFNIWCLLWILNVLSESFCT